MDKLVRYVRLAAVSGMTGKRWVEAATQLDAAHDDPMPSGLDARQRQQYQDLPEKQLDALRSWLDSRNGSHYGRYWCDWFTQHLTLSGLTITSGLARGIDGVAHQAALNAGGKTVTVLGCGLRHLYPKSHLSLAREIIVEQGGALISEFPLTAIIPHPLNFPRRNRIISGLSLDMLVVEVSLKSGSLVTARYALEQNRNVYALLGALGNPLSEGVNWLIQQGALLVAHPNNILEDLASALNWLPVTQSDQIYSEVSDDAPLPFADVLANVGNDVTPVDVIAERAG